MTASTRRIATGHIREVVRVPGGGGVGGVKLVSLTATSVSHRVTPCLAAKAYRHCEPFLWRVHDGCCREAA